MKKLPNECIVCESDEERAEKTIIREPIENMLLSRMRKIVHNKYEVIRRRDNEIIVLRCGKHLKQDVHPILVLLATYFTARATILGQLVRHIFQLHIEARRKM